jgi:hypothetical protein
MFTAVGLSFAGLVVSWNIHISSPAVMSFLVHMVLPGVCLAIGTMLFLDGRDGVRNAQMDRAATAQDVLTKDGRAPVLYLRSCKRNESG